MTAFDTVHMDCGPLVIEEGKILRFGLNSFHRKHKNLPISTLAKRSLEFAPPLTHLCHITLFLIRHRASH